MIDERIELAQELLEQADELESRHCTYDCFYCDCGFDYDCPKTCSILQAVSRLRNQADKLLLD